MAILPAALLLAAALSSSSAQALPDSSRPAAQPPTPALSKEARGDIYMAEKKFREAVEAYRSGPAESAVVQNKLGIAYQHLEQLDSARSAYERAIKLRPDYMEALNNLGTIYEARKSYRSAIRWYSRALKTVPGEVRGAVVYVNLSRAWSDRKDDARSRECMQSALRLDPDVYQRHSDVGDVVENPSIAERAKYHFNQAKAYAALGRNDLALQYLRSALEEGFKAKKNLDGDPDFATLKDLPAFKDLMEHPPRAL